MSQLLANCLVTASIAFLLAISFAAVYWSGRFFFFALGGTTTFSAYVGFETFRGTDSFVLSLGAAVVSGIVLGAVLEQSVHRPLRRRGASGEFLLLGSLGAYIVIVNLVSLVWGEQVRVLAPSGERAFLAALGVRVTGNQASLVLLALGLALGSWFFLMKTTGGRAFRAVVQDPELAGVFGVNEALVHRSSVAFACGIAGLTGMLVASDTDLRPTMGFPILILGVAAALIARPGVLAGLFWGAALVGIGQNLTAWYVGMEWRESATLLILLAALFVRREKITKHQAQNPEPC